MLDRLKGGERLGTLLSPERGMLAARKRQGRDDRCIGRASRDDDVGARRERRLDLLGTGERQRLTHHEFGELLKEHHAGAIRAHEARAAMPAAVRRQLTPEAKSRALACLKRFGQRLRGMPASSVLAVGTNPDWGLLAISATSGTVLLLLGYRWFKSLERDFADVV
mgnify:CR=1 FL=1